MSCPKYTYEVGTDFGDDISGFGENSDEIVREELESQLWSLFSNSSVWTTSTAYDWTQVSDEARSQNGNVKVRAEPERIIPPGS